MEAFGIPGLTSFLAFNDPAAAITGLKDFPPEERPPVALTFWGFRVMVLLGIYFLLVALGGWYLERRGRLLDTPWYLKLLLYSVPLPYLAINLGWMVTEVGRQPWAVYGLMQTAKAVFAGAGGQRTGLPGGYERTLCGPGYLGFLPAGPYG